VRPSADRFNVAITEVPVNLDNPDDYAKDLARQILDRNAGQTVLVVGHRNTIGPIVEALSGKQPGKIEDRYTDLFTVVISPDGKSRLIKAEYGAK
jgi:hypothetical protein